MKLVTLVAFVLPLAVAAPITYPDDKPSRTVTPRVLLSRRAGDDRYDHGSFDASLTPATNFTYTAYGNYGSYPPPPGGYKSYGSYAAYPTAYTSYGSYKRQVGNWLKSFWR